MHFHSYVFIHNFNLHLKRKEKMQSDFFSFFLWFTLLSNLDLPASKVGLFDVFDAKVSIALGVLLLFVPRRRLIVRAVRVRCR